MLISSTKIRVLIPHHKLVVENGKSFTVYCIEVVCDGKVTNVERRYSEFYELYKKLSKMMDAKISFPPKRILNNKDIKLLEARKKGLELYLQTVLYTFQDDVPERLLEFLAIPNYYDEHFEERMNEDMDGSVDDENVMYQSAMNTQYNMICFRKDAYLVPTLKELEEEAILPDIVMRGCLDGIYKK